MKNSNWFNKRTLFFEQAKKSPKSEENTVGTPPKKPKYRQESPPEVQDEKNYQQNIAKEYHRR